MRRASVKIDQIHPVCVCAHPRVVFAGDSTQLDLDGLLYIGGVGAPFAPLTVPPVLWTGSLRQGYVGCMRDLVINGNPVDIAGYAQQQDSGECDFWANIEGERFTGQR